MKKDPDAPKKPLSAYMLWLQNSRPAIKKKLPGATIGEIGKKAGEMWKALNPEEKSVSVGCEKCAVLCWFVLLLGRPSLEYVVGELVLCVSPCGHVWVVILILWGGYFRK